MTDPRTSRLSRRQLLAGTAAVVGAAGLGATGLGLSGVGRGVVPPTPVAAPEGTGLAGLKLISWYPYQAGWEHLWTTAPLTEIAEDFQAICALGANAVRVIISTYTFGYPEPDPAMLAKLHAILQQAASNGLRVQLTLFDLFGDFADIPGSLHWAQSVLAGLANDPRLCFVELHNEVDPTDDQALRWVGALCPSVKAAVGTTPVTASVTSAVGPAAMAKWADAVEGLQGMDFLDYHWYGPPGSALSGLAEIKALAGDRQLFIGETGTSSQPGGVGPSMQLDALQASYIQEVMAACAQLDLTIPAPWVWRDFTPLALPDVGNDPGGLYFGLLRVDGTRKLAYGVVERAFAASDARARRNLAAAKA